MTDDYDMLVEAFRTLLTAADSMPGWVREECGLDDALDRLSQMCDKAYDESEEVTHE